MAAKSSQAIISRSSFDGRRKTSAIAHCENGKEECLVQGAQPKRSEATPAPLQSWLCANGTAFAVGADKMLDRDPGEFHEKKQVLAGGQASPSSQCPQLDVATPNSHATSDSFQPFASPHCLSRELNRNKTSGFFRCGFASWAISGFYQFEAGSSNQERAEKNPRTPFSGLRQS